MVGVHAVVVACIVDAGGGGDGHVIQVVAEVVVVASLTPAVGCPWGGDCVVGADADRRHCPGSGNGDGRCAVVAVVAINAGGVVVGGVVGGRRMVVVVDEGELRL